MIEILPILFVGLMLKLLMEEPGEQTSAESSSEEDLTAAIAQYLAKILAESSER